MFIRIILGTKMTDHLNIAAEEYLIAPDLGVEYIRHSQHGVVAINDKGIIILVNRSAELMFGYQRSELLGQPIEILLPDSLKEKHQGHRTGFLDSPRNRPMGIGLELKGKRKNGVEIPIDINLIPVPSVNNLITIAEISRKL